MPTAAKWCNQASLSCKSKLALFTMVTECRILPRKVKINLPYTAQDLCTPISSHGNCAPKCGLSSTSEAQLRCAEPNCRSGHSGHSNRSNHATRFSHSNHSNHSDRSGRANHSDHSDRSGRANHSDHAHPLLATLLPPLGQCPHHQR